jgi:hypothetical protein
MSEGIKLVLSTAKNTETTTKAKTRGTAAGLHFEVKSERWEDLIY